MEEKRIPPRPLLSKIVAKWLNPLNRFFDWIYHSEYNPLYRSGTLAIGLLLVLLVTGLYLVFFYSVSSPYASVANIQSQVWAGRWIRALHRYATDATLIAIFFHVLQLLAQGKTWGPRTLAWVSGIFLTLAFLVSAWTGYVMVWDQHGQLFALSGLQLLRSIPFFRGDLGQAFSGITPLPSSFFFMNLFLHVAIPLGMVLGMWIHTARLARTIWFPRHRIFVWTVVGLFTLSIFFPTPLLGKADLLILLDRIPTDWWIGIWIPLIDLLSPKAVLILWAVIFLVGITIPWWWKPSRHLEPSKSKVDEETCSGCTQCVRDCPYEAIRMKPHPNGKHLLAEISENMCVSCGICVASCDDLAIGPPDRNSIEQLKLIEEYCQTSLGENAKEAIVILGCKNNDSLPEYLKKYVTENKSIFYYDLNCCGTLHSKSIEKFLDHCAGLLLVGCAVRNCMNRDGFSMLEGRIFAKRVPFLAKNIDRSRIVITSNSEFEKKEIIERLSYLQTNLSKAENKKIKSYNSGFSWVIKRTVASTILLGTIAWFNQAPLGSSPTHSELRVVGRLPGQTKLNCRTPAPEEQAELPMHMKQKEICERNPIIYNLQITVDDKLALKKKITGESIRSDIPVFVNEQLALMPGKHKIKVEVNKSADGRNLKPIINRQTLMFRKGVVRLISLADKS
jgi:NAD-dependent dihydropyrimidine dehydrogenase PreA subunit/coenzyme F420-reducing hydrogenase delta subunit